MATIVKTGSSSTVSAYQAKQKWVESQLVLLDIESHKLIDGDNRATMTAEDISTKRIVLRDYVTNENRELKVNGERPSDLLD